MNNIRKMALEFLLEQEHISKFPINYNDLIYTVQQNNWAIYTYSEFVPCINITEDNGKKLMECIKSNKGFVINNKGTPTIIFNDRLPYIEKIYVIAHEIGHIKLEHKTLSLNDYDISRAEKEIHEYEAGVFATEFLAPQPILREIGLSTIYDMLNLSLLPEQQSEKQFCNITKPSSEFFTSDKISKKTVHKFKQYINQSSKKLNKTKRTKRLAMALFYFIVLCATVSFLITKKPTNITKNAADNVIQESNTAIQDINEEQVTQNKGKSETNSSSKSTQNTTTKNQTIKHNIPSTKTTAQPAYKPIPTTVPTSPSLPITKVFVVSGGSKEYHNARCERIANEYAIMSFTIEEAQIYGYIPCPVCCK